LYLSNPKVLERVAYAELHLPARTDVRGAEQAVPIFNDGVQAAILEFDDWASIIRVAFKVPDRHVVEVDELALAAEDVEDVGRQFQSLAPDGGDLLRLGSSNGRINKQNAS